MIDLNCDMGENAGDDASLMKYISSANIACGFHAGDEDTMEKTVDLCIKHHVAIGAHPSFFDKKNFGREEMNLKVDEIYDLIILQLRSLQKITEAKGISLHHVKPHGA